MNRPHVVKGVRKLIRLPPLAIFHKVARVVPFRPVDAGRLYFLAFDDVPRVRRAMLRGVATVREATLADIEGLTALEDKREVFEHRFADGDHCIAAVANHRIVGYESFSERSPHRETEWGYEIAIPPGAVYAYDAYIDPAYRNGGTWLRFKAHLGEWMAAHDKHQIITFVEEGNAASWNAHIRFGFRPAGVVLAVRILGMHAFRVRPANEVSASPALERTRSAILK
jgi:L-amino acid N-acyltransferase YncA